MFPVRKDAPAGWLVADLLHEGLCTEAEQLSLQPSSYNAELSMWFEVRNHSIYTSTSGNGLSAIEAPRLFLLEILASKPPSFKRIIMVQVEVQAGSSPKFLLSTYSASLDAEAISDSKVQLNFSQTISLGTHSSSDIIYEIVSLPEGSAKDLFQMMSSRDETTHKQIAKLFVVRKLHTWEKFSQPVKFYIGATDKRLQKRVASTRIEVTIKQAMQPPPAFERSRIVMERPLVQAHKTLLRVIAKTAKGVPMYHVEPESSPFDVAPLFGDVFSKTHLPSGHYIFDVVAIDSMAQEGRTTIDLTISSQTNSPRSGQQQRAKQRNLAPLDKDRNFIGQRSARWARKSRRDRGEDLLLLLREDHPLGFLKQRIPLHSDERISKPSSSPSASPDPDFLAVHKNGSIELLKALNYERESHFQLTVQVDGMFKSRMQTIRVEVLDVNEPPFFLNEPKPYLAVVPLQTPLGYQVYRFHARDENGEGNDNVTYQLINTEPANMFTVDEHTGSVRTAQRQYTQGQYYRISVRAIDNNYSYKESQEKKEEAQDQIALLEVFAGERPPQFMRQKYVVYVPEHSEVQHSVLQLETLQFPSIRDGHTKGERTYAISLDNDPSSSKKSEQETSAYFGVEPNTGLIHLLKQIDYDDPAQTKTFRMFGIVKEEGRESRVPIEINVQDINDNAPTFVQPLYTATVKEDVEIGHTIVKVEARDQDSGINAQLDYFVDHPHFSINSHGEISASSRLDADQKQEGFHFYRFNVTATDRGIPVPLKGSALVHIRTENTNDEAPVFVPTAEYTASVAEDAQANTPVVQVQAIDPDRDQVTYWFKVDGSNELKSKTDLFEVDRDTGLIRLRAGLSSSELMKLDAPFLLLTVVAKDDGSCCAASTETHESTAKVRVSIADINNNKPEFPHCADYKNTAVIEEGQYKTAESPVIITAQAVDKDSSLNGQIVYSLYYGRSETRKPFVIDANTGELRPSPYFVFDRESKSKEEVTIKATDKGERPLIGFCQFSVQVLDVNDNAPQFDRPLYETSLARNAATGSSVLAVLAEDSDSPTNARITYSLAADETASEANQRDHSFFEISSVEQPGEITLLRKVPKDKDRFMFSVIATDNGQPEARTAIVQVVVKVHEKQQNAPQWQSSPDCKEVSSVYEDIQINTVLIRCHALVGEDRKRPISYKLSNGVKHTKNNKQIFRSFPDSDNVNLVVVRNMESLDYEQCTNYSLTLTATDMISSATSEKHFLIHVKDRNDEVPRFTVDQFTGSIDEELSPAEYMDISHGEPITTVTAFDLDSRGEPQSEIYYRILDDTDSIQPASRYFRIDERSGKIFPLEKFDHERNDSFIFDVEARDGMNSSLPYTHAPNKDIVKVQIFVADLNDNAPRFENALYEASVPENIDVSQEILTIKAYDLDSQSLLRYSLTSATGNKLPFGVKTDTGVIYVKEPLDFESLHKHPFYQFQLQATDGKYTAQTNIQITLYKTTIKEEESPTNLPMLLFTVNATDTDKDETNGQIVYELEGQGVGQYFRIDRLSGQIEVYKPLDRDPPSGVPVWKFIVQAADNGGKGLVGYADVEVWLLDVNDNSPVFPRMQYGAVKEGNAVDAYVMTAAALDYDDPATPNAQLTYNIVGANKYVNGEPIFRIDEDSGKIYAMVG
uniref:Cadherin domain-containing protein n=1 Tax=Ditylenchus dipsaci TaxID=166011 RepID=A0A915E4Z3_9BILA